MSLLTLHYRRMRTFVHLLIVLLIFNFIFNLYFTWYGISIIVRVYLFVFSFYLVYNYASVDVERIRELYNRRFGKKANLFIVFEMGLMPLFIIYGITIIFTFIDYIRLPHWPWNPILSLLNGRYSNIVIYSLLLFIIMKTRFGPTVKIALFFGSSIVYFIADKYLGILFPHGIGLVAVRLLKLLIIFYFLFFNFLEADKKKWAIYYASTVASFIFLVVVCSHYLVFRYSSPNSYQYVMAGLSLIKYGFWFPIPDVGNSVVEQNDHSFVKEYIELITSLKKEVQFTPQQWERLVTTGSMENINYIAGILLDKQIPISFEKLVAVAKEKTKDSLEHFDSASNYISLFAKNAKGKTKLLLSTMNGTIENENYMLFTISVLGEMKDDKAIPRLLEYLTGANFKLSIAAYDALKKITGKDPAGEKNIQRNDPLSVATFYEFYKKNRTTN